MRETRSERALVEEGRAEEKGEMEKVNQADRRRTEMRAMKRWCSRERRVEKERDREYFSRVYIDIFMGVHRFSQTSARATLPGSFNRSLSELPLRYRLFSIT